jgi:hypothetical protein
MNHQEKTIIIGGGIAGISCALKLREAGKPFVMIAERLGGRVYYDDELKVNFGAYFMVHNYENVKKILKKATPLSKTNGQYHNNEKDYYKIFRLKTLGQIPQFIRFGLTMVKFMRHYKRYKERCEIMSDRQAISSDPYIKRLFFQPALDFIDEKRFVGIHEDYFSKFSYACMAVKADQINALDYLIICIALVLPIHRHVFDNKGIAEMFKNELIIDSVTSIKRTDKGYKVTTKSGKVLQEKYTVVATPGFVTKQLLDIPYIRESYMLSTSHVTGTLKKKYRKYFMNLFAEGAPIIAISIQDDGSYIVHASVSTEEDYLDNYFDNYIINKKVTWEKALYTEGKDIVDEQVKEFGKNLYIAGEHNSVGMEPSAISGIYAANEIIRSMM